MPVGHALLRNLKHKAYPSGLGWPFDDHEVSTLASIIKLYRPVYNRCPSTFSSVVFKHVQPLQSNSTTTYKAEKAECQHYAATAKDVTRLLKHFSSLTDDDLTPWSDIMLDQAGLAKNTLSTPIDDDRRIVVVRPQIEECLFCNHTLIIASTTTSSAGKAPGGYCWGYEEHLGACTAVLCKGTCPECATVYSLQTYTPGEPMLR
jgi:hypothetical protein